MSELLSTDEVAKRLNVPKSWIYDRTRRGKIPCYKLGKYRKFKLEEVDLWLQNFKKDDTWHVSNR